MNDLFSNCHPCEACSQCSALVQSRSQIVYPTKIVKSKLLVIGEAPGRDEDIKGIGFVGSAGKTLHRILSKYNILPGSYSLANICWCRPENNRKPTLQEIENCLPKLNSLIKELKPQIILTVGATPSKVFCGAGNLYDKILERQDDCSSNKCYNYVHPLLQSALIEVAHVVPAPHTSPLAFNRNAPSGEKWGVIFEQQIARINQLLFK